MTVVVGRPIPVAAGVGLRAFHHERFRHGGPAVAWLEVHSENYFAVRGAAAEALERIREHYPLSLHGVGLSLGSADALDTGHLRNLSRLIDRVEPGLVSEHLAWGAVGGLHLNDLLPLPHTEAALSHVVEQIDRAQRFLRRELAIENVSAYFELAASEMTEWEFLVGVARRAGCKILLDLNNLYVNSCNNGFSAAAYLESIPRDLVAEIHLAGHSVERYGGQAILIDTHDGPVCEAVWRLYRKALRRFGPVPTLIEWDTALPPLETLLAEADRAELELDAVRSLAA